MSPFRRAACVVVAAFVVATAQAAMWKIDAAHSKLTFAGTQAGAPFNGQFTRYEASVVFDPAHLDTSSIKVTVDAASATTANPQRDNAMPGKDWFDVAEFPHAEFATHSIARGDSGGYHAQGTLTIRGVTRSVTVPVTVDISGDSVHLKGHLQLNRADYGIGQGPWSNPEWVGLQVDVDFDLVGSRG